MKDILNIPFVKLSTISSEDTGSLSLDKKDEITNHINTIHAGAIFTLAETQSGVYLKEIFPSLDGMVIPILRESQIKYKKPAEKKIFAYADVSDEAIDKFKKIFENKSRATIRVDVKIKDLNNIIAIASFTWYIQRLD